MKQSLLTILRDRNTKESDFRRASDRLADLLAAEASLDIPQEPVSIQTPMGSAKGVRMGHNAVLIPILRAGLALLPAFMRVFDTAKVGFFGIRRNEGTAVPHQYYEKLPSFEKKDYILMLDPMIATGGSALLALNRLVELGAVPSQISLTGVLAAKEGLEAIRKRYPQVKLRVVAEDPELNAQKFIIPGLGDFGDRYFANK